LCIELHIHAEVVKGIGLLGKPGKDPRVEMNDVHSTTLPPANELESIFTIKKEKFRKKQ
jgi:hypothetical protein